MNKKTMSMIAMVATIIYTIMYATNQLYMIGSYFHPMMITTILKFLLTTTMFVFIAIFFRFTARNIYLCH